MIIAASIEWAKVLMRMHSQSDVGAACTSAYTWPAAANRMCTRAPHLDRFLPRLHPARMSPSKDTARALVSSLYPLARNMRRAFVDQSWVYILFLCIGAFHDSLRQQRDKDQWRDNLQKPFFFFFLLSGFEKFHLLKNFLLNIYL